LCVVFLEIYNISNISKNKLHKSIVIKYKIDFSR